jgi:hypothetical protein
MANKKKASIEQSPTVLSLTVVFVFLTFVFAATAYFRYG